MPWTKMTIMGGCCTGTRLDVLSPLFVWNFWEMDRSYSTLGFRMIRKVSS